MKFLSKTQYENETNPYELKDKLIDIGLLGIYFAKAAINIAKSVRHLIPEAHEKVSLKTLEMAEKYLRGEVTIEECHEAGESIPIAPSIDVTAATYTAYRAVSYASIATDRARVAAFTAFTATKAASAVCYVSVVRVIAKDIIEVAACDMFRKTIPWNLVCATQIAKCFGNQKNEQFIQEITKNEKLINYATIILEDENLRKEFEFLMKDYVNK